MQGDNNITDSLHEPQFGYYSNSKKAKEQKNEMLNSYSYFCYENKL